MEIDRRKKPSFKEFFANKNILGPMVRVGTLPMRLFALRSGADLVYSEEIIDFKLIKSTRFVNHELRTVDFIDESGSVVFRTCEEEKSRVIVQLGTNDGSRAVLAAKMVEDDVAGIDVNMGCPKSFSLKGGMGAALLSNPDKIHDILSSLKANIRKPISCKIRVLSDLDATVQLAKLIEQTGVDALAIHGRTKEERPQHANREHYIRAVAAAVEIPVICNGGSSSIHRYEDIFKFRELTHSSSVMISRAAMRNCSIFAKSNFIEDLEELIRIYLKLAFEYDNNAINSKYCIQQMLGHLQESEKGKQLLGSYDHEAMSKIFNLHDYYLHIENEHKARKAEETFNPEPIILTEDKENLVELPVVFDKNLFTPNILPKSILNRWTTKNNHKTPRFNTYQVEKQFHSKLNFQGKEYSSPYLEKTKKAAEQSAAMVLLLTLGLCDDSNITDKCLVSERNYVDSLKHYENGRAYLIKINK